MMAKKRMFSKDIVRSDAFISLPRSSRLLYYDLCLDADDYGCVSNPFAVLNLTSAKKQDIEQLISKRFILKINNIIVIKHWFINNNIRKDRKLETVYQDVIDTLEVKPNGSYTEKKHLNTNQVTTNSQPSDNQKAPQYSKVEKSIVYKSVGECNNANQDVVNITNIHKEEFFFVNLTEGQKERIKNDFPNVDLDLQMKLLDDYVKSNNNKNGYTDWNIIIRKSIKDKWFKRDTERKSNEPDWYPAYREDFDKKLAVKKTLSKEEVDEILNNAKNIFSNNLIDQ